MRVTYVQRFQGTGMLCKEEVVSGAVWSLTGPQILGRPTTYLGALPSSPRVSSRRGGGALAAHQRFWSQMCTAVWGGDAGEQGEGSVPQREVGCGSGRVSVPRGTGKEGMEENSCACPSTFPLLAPMRSCQRGFVSLWGQC